MTIKNNKNNTLWQAVQGYAAGLLGAWLERAAQDGWLQFHPADGSVIWPHEVKAALTKHFRALNGDPVTPPASVDVATLWPTFLARLDAALPTDPWAERWHDLFTRLRLSPSEAQLITWLVALNLDAALARVWRYAWANTMRDALTWGFAALVLRAVHGDPDPTCGLSDDAPALSLGLITLHRPDPATLREALPINLAPEVFAWLCGGASAFPEHQPLDDIPQPPARLTSLGPRLRDLRALPGPARAAVIGPDDPSRAAVVGLVATACRARGVWTLDVARALSQGRWLDALRRAKRMACLLDAAVAVLTADAPPDGTWTRDLLDAFQGCPAALVWVGEDDPPQGAPIGPEAVLRVGHPSPAQRRAAWSAALTAALTAASLDADTPQALADRYLLTEGQISDIARRCLDPTLSAPALTQRLHAACREVAQRGLGRLATPERGGASMDQLLVNDDTAAALAEVLQGVQQRRAMVALFEGKVSYGVQGVTCLFTGPPGTGKTLAARVIASALGMELYRVDLSQLVDRYIGETEKRLGALFNAAEASEVILLFDEADSLFGKRTEVKTSTDRYANLEVNYLLQRIEHFGGVVILTTNLESSIDDAFARRIRFKVAFDAPDAPTRLKIWSQLWPPTLARAPDLDLAAFARDYDLSGGHIKEVIVRAAALALGESQGEVTRSQLTRCASLEYRKLGKLTAAPLTPPTRTARPSALTA